MFAHIQFLFTKLGEEGAKSPHGAREAFDKLLHNHGDWSKVSPC